MTNDSIELNLDITDGDYVLIDVKETGKYIGAETRGVYCSAFSNHVDIIDVTHVEYTRKNGGFGEHTIGLVVDVDEELLTDEEAAILDEMLGASL